MTSLRPIRALAVLSALSFACSNTTGNGPPGGSPPPTVTAPPDMTAPPPSRPPSSGPPAVVSFVKVVSDRVEDVSSLDAWKASFLKAGMTDEEKAKAIWTSVVKFRHQDVPAREYLQDTPHAHDAIRVFNVYGYSQCDCTTSFTQELARVAGIESRGRSIHNHVVPELKWDGAWHMLDGSYINHFTKADGSIATVDDIIGEVSAWYAANPGMLGNTPALVKMRDDGTWKTNGPAIVARCPFIDVMGFLPAGAQGWDETMRNYDGTVNVVEDYGYSDGYRVNVQLRKGERLTRNWSNKGDHLNAQEGLYCESLATPVGQGGLRYSPAYGDLAPGRVGNGSLDYDVPLADPELIASALETTNLAQGGAPRLAVADASKDATLVVRLPSSYVFLGASVALDAAVGAGGNLALFISDNHGLDWKPLPAAQSGPQTIDLSAYAFRRYDFRLKIVMSGAGTGLDKLQLHAEVQHSQRALPALAQGDNTITFSAGPPEGTITIEGSTDLSTVGKNLLYTDFHPTVDGIAGNPLEVSGTTGTITFPVDTQGDLTRLRFGGFFRASQTGDAWELRVSVDGGKTFVPVANVNGPTEGQSQSATFTAIPPGTRHALVQYAGTHVSRALLFSFRIDADYLEPSGGFRPVKITYAWRENGQPKQDVHIAASPADSYSNSLRDPAGARFDHRRASRLTKVATRAPAYECAAL